MNSIRTIGFFFIILALTHPLRAAACETHRLTMSGTLDASAAIAAVPPIFFGTTTYNVLQSTASFSTFTEIYDSLGLTHTLKFYFYHTESNAWTVLSVIDGGDVFGGTLDMPVELGVVSLIFGSDGTRVNPPSNGVPDGILTPSLSNGAAGTYISVSFEPFTQLSSASAIRSTSQNGTAGACIQPSRLDFDGDGIDDFVIWRPQFGMWAVLLSSTNYTQYLWKQWGLPGDYPMPGDYTGDGKTDLVVWRPSNGNWYVCSSDTNYDCTQGTVWQFGLPGDRPISGDFDGDGIFDFAIWRPGTGTFFYRSSRSGQVVSRQWGLPGDIPLNAGVNK